MGQGVGDSFFPQLELWPRPRRSEDFSLRFVDAHGNEDELDAQRLAHSIRAVGDELDEDTALSLARAAMAHLRHSQEPEPFAQAVVTHTVERALREMGLGRAARRYRDRHDAVSVETLEAPAFARWDALVHAETALRHAAAWLRRADAPEDARGEIEAALRSSLAVQDPVTPGWVREFVLTQLLQRGLRLGAEQIAHVPLSVAEVESIHRGEFSDLGDRTIADVASAAYARSRVFPARVCEAHRRGTIALRADSDLVRLDRIFLDVEGAKSAEWGDDESDRAPLTDPTGLARRLSQWTKWLAPSFANAVSWYGVNFAYAPLLAGLDTREHARSAYALFFELASAEHRSDRPRTELEFCWDPPASSGDSLIGPRGLPVRIEDAYEPARAFLAEALKALVGLAERPTPVVFPAVTLRLSPYFFGAPEASDLLDSVARIVAAGFPIQLRHDVATPLPLAIAHEPSHSRVIAHTVTLRLGKLLGAETGLNDACARIEEAIDIAAEAHAARHRHIAGLADHRSGIFAPLREPFGHAPLLNLSAVEYAVHFDATGCLCDAQTLTALATRARQACDRWSNGTGTIHRLAEAPGAALAADPRAQLLAAAERHPHFDDPAPVPLQRDAALSDPARIAEFIRWAFLYTPCRALQFV